MPNLQEKRIFFTYEAVLLIKGLQAFLEITAGILFALINTNTITTVILFLAHGEVAESPHDILSNILIQSAHQLTVADKFFIISYLLLHGIVKLVLITGLFLKKSWAYPASIIGLSGLMLYQLYRLTVVRYSLFLLILTIIDAVILWLIIREHKVRIHFDFF